MKFRLRLILTVLGAGAVAGLALASAHVIGVSTVESVAAIVVVAGTSVGGPFADLVQDRSAAEKLRWENQVAHNSIEPNGVRRCGHYNSGDARLANVAIRSQQEVSLGMGNQQQRKPVDSVDLDKPLTDAVNRNAVAEYYIATLKQMGANGDVIKAAEKALQHSEPVTSEAAHS